MKRLTSLILVLLCLVCTRAFAEGETARITLLVKSYPHGPGVSALIIRLGEPVSDIRLNNLHVVTAGIEREVIGYELCDQSGQPVGTPSEWLLVRLSDKAVLQCPLFSADQTTGKLGWAATYPVAFSTEATTETMSYQIALQEDCISRRVSPDRALFGDCMEWCGSYLNRFTNNMEQQTIRMAAYEPETLMGGEPNPLIIWLHGGGEGGSEIDVALLGNEVSNLAKEQIQHHFTSGDGSMGAYVLIPQCETFWMDEGSGQIAQGAGVSRYTAALMDAIDWYLASNPDVDTKRIYLGGCSNGGYMTLNMLVEYPDVFAAAFAVCEAYDTTQNEERLEALVNQSIWFVQSVDDMVVDPERYMIPTYVDLMFDDAQDCWMSMFSGYHHAVWNAVFRDLVNGVQNPVLVYEEETTAPDHEKGGSYTANGIANMFDWLNLHQNDCYDLQ